MLIGISLVAIAEILYPGFTNMAKNDQLYRYGFGLFLGSPIVVCLSIALFYKVRGKNYPRWFGFEGFEVRESKKYNEFNSSKFSSNNHDNFYNRGNYSMYSYSSGNIYNRFK